MDQKYDELEKKIEALESEIQYWKKEVLDLEQLTICKLKNPYLEFEVHLADHCNLNCKGCDHFSPLAEEHYTSIEEYERDLIRLSDLFGDKVRRIRLLGGEPLLNPSVVLFMQLTRKYFPYHSTAIELMTNGLLISKQSKEFYDACRDCCIRIRITKYPVNFMYDELLQKLLEMGINASFFNDITHEKTLDKMRLTKDEQMDVRRNFYKCTVANKCVMLKNGKLYPCTLIPNIEHFNKYFDENFEVSARDFIDIYSAQSDTEIMEFLHNPVPFCRYCNIEEKEYDLEWGISKKQKSEWM